MTIKDTFGIYREVDVDAETWTQLYQSGLLRNGVLDFTNLERSNDHGHHDNIGRRDRNQGKY